MEQKLKSLDALPSLSKEVVVEIREFIATESRKMRWKKKGQEVMVSFKGMEATLMCDAALQAFACMFSCKVKERLAMHKLEWLPWERDLFGTASRESVGGCEPFI